ncbi:MAG: hypothetical protein QOJ03_2833 [Frankiaceae bacterium]|jgi:hypothetical protein|nr:hypothetical protein [Frankiaceae bacterium]
MTERDTAATLRAVLETRAEHAMAITDTDRELDRLRERMRPTNRARRMRIVVAAAAGAAVIGTGTGLALTWGNGTADRVGPTPGTQPPSSGRTLPAGTVPAGFPSGTFSHAGTYGLTSLTLSRHGTATMLDPRDTLPTVMTMTFTTPNVVRFAIQDFSGPTVPCGEAPASYTYAIAGDALTFTPVVDSCGARRIPLSEKSWGPISSTH